MNNIYRLEIVGRVITTKGLKYIFQFCNYCEFNRITIFLNFIFCGIGGDISGVRDFIKETKAYNTLQYFMV